jgi:hypothetical protein
VSSTLPSATLDPRLSPVAEGEPPPRSDRLLRALEAQSAATAADIASCRGSPACDVAAVEDVLLRVSALAEDHPQIAEMDCNPVIVNALGASVVDARIRVAPAAPRRPLGARH